MRRWTFRTGWMAGQAPLNPENAPTRPSGWGLVKRLRRLTPLLPSVPDSRPSASDDSYRSRRSLLSGGTLSMRLSKRMFLLTRGCRLSPALFEFHGRLGARMDVKLFVDVLQVPFHGGNGDTQSVRDGFVAQPLHDEFQDFTLTIGQALDLRGGGSLLTKLANDFARNFRRHRHAALVCFLDRGENFFGLSALEQVTARSGTQRPENYIGVLVHGEDDDLQFWHLSFDFLRTLHASRIRQLDVHQYDVRLGLRDFVQRFGDRLAGAHAFEARCPIEQR